MFNFSKKAVVTDEKQIEEVLSRGVVEVIDRESLKNKLKSGKELRIKLGIDPTSPNIHLGRAIQLMKLRDFQKLGHKIVLIIGDFTAVIGDTSDKDSERPMLTEEQVKKNLKDYEEQAAKVIDIDKCEIHFNSKWLGKLSYTEICKQADVFSLSDFIARENISKRLDGGKRVSMRELMYPLMQGYDSVAIKADVELGATDQRFNLLAGRELQRYYGEPVQDIVMSTLIEGLDGRKMSSSWGNTINLKDDAKEMHGKIMSLRDDLIIKYFTLCTRQDSGLINDYENQLKNGANPRDIKMKLAFEIVKFYHGEKEAQKAEDFFVNTFSKKEVPEDVKEVMVEKGEMIREVLVKEGIVSSNADWKRLIDGHAVYQMDPEMKVVDYFIKAEETHTYRIGKKRFVKIIVK